MRTDRPISLSDQMTSLFREHVQNYLRVLPYNAQRVGVGHHRYLEDILDISGIERLPGGITAALEFCQKHPRTSSLYCFTSTVWKWILKHIKYTSSGTGGGIDRERYLWILQQVSRGAFKFSDDGPLLRAIARIPHPPDLSPDERNTVTVIWRSVLQNEFPPQSPETRGVVQNRLYLLSNDRDERLQILQERLPLSLEDPLWSGSPIWSERIREHCRQYPEDAIRLRMHCMESIRRYQIGACQDSDLGRCFGLSLLGVETPGVEEAEFRLLNIIRERFQEKASVDEVSIRDQWALLSRWQPASPSVRSRLLDWWYGLSPADRSPWFPYRSNAIFALEEDESRLVALIADTPPAARPPVIPSGWFPRCPRLQMQLLETVTGRLETYLSPAHQISFYSDQSHLWQLLFRLPVSGAHMTRLIRSACGENLTGMGNPANLSCIRNHLRSPGLPADTSVDDIRQTVDTILTRLKAPEEKAWRKRELAFLTVELVREYLRQGESSPADAATAVPGLSGTGAVLSSSGPAVGPGMPDLSWVNSTLEFITWNGNVPWDEYVRAGVPAGSFFASVANVIVPDDCHAPPPPPGSRSLIHHLWLTGIHQLTEFVARPELKTVICIEDLLQTLTVLTRELSSSSFAPRPDTGGLSFPPRLWEALSSLVQHPRTNNAFVTAVAIGNALVAHASQEQQVQWWTALCNVNHNPFLVAAFPDELAILQRHFLLGHLSPTFEKTGEKTGRELSAPHFADSTSVLRQLRARMHLFPQYSPAARRFWAEIWTETFENWKMEHRDMNRPVEVVSVTAGMHPAAFMDKQFIATPAPDRLSGGSGFLSGTESPLPVTSRRLSP